VNAVAAAPINLTDLLVSPAMAGASSSASHAAYGIPRQSWRGVREQSEPMVLYAPSQALSAGWFHPSVEGISSVLRLRRGWDSYDARPITHVSAQSALTFLSRVLEATTAPPAVVPLADGGVQIEWHRGGLDVEIAFSPGDAPEMYIADHETGASWDLDPSTADFEEVRPLLARLRAE